MRVLTLCTLCVSEHYLEILTLKIRMILVQFHAFISKANVHAIVLKPLTAKKKKKSDEIHKKYIYYKSHLSHISYGRLNMYACEFIISPFHISYTIPLCTDRHAEANHFLYINAWLQRTISQGPCIVKHYRPLCYDTRFQLGTPQMCIPILHNQD